MLYFQHLCRFLYSPKISDYPHLNITMTISSTYITEDLSCGKFLSSYCFLFYLKPKWAYKLPRSSVLSVTRKCVYKTLCPQHISDPKGEWSLKENNSKLHYGNIQKLISSSTPWSATICQISGSYPKQFFRYFVHKVVPTQNACCVRKRGVTQPKIYGIGSKFNQFIYTLICIYRPNIRILAKAVLQIFCSQGCSYTKCLCLIKGSNST